MDADREDTMEKSTLMAVIKKDPFCVIAFFLGLLFLLYVLFFKDAALRGVLAAVDCILWPIGWLCNAASEKVESPSAAKRLKAAYCLLLVAGYALLFVSLFVDIMP